MKRKTINIVTVMIAILFAVQGFSQEETLMTKQEIRQGCDKTVTNHLAFKTNLLYIAVGAPNLELELQHRSFSFNFEYQFPWYVNSGKRFAYELISFGVEGRYWFADEVVDGRCRGLTGPFLGLYTGLGLFDFQYKDDGTQGEIETASGISFGYSTQISHSLNLELSMGLGVIITNNRYYYPFEDLLIKTSASRFQYIGPTKAKVSLVWVLFDKYRGGGR